MAIKLQLTDLVGVIHKHVYVSSDEVSFVDMVGNHASISAFDTEEGEAWMEHFVGNQAHLVNTPILSVTVTHPSRPAPASYNNDPHKWTDIEVTTALGSCTMQWLSFDPDNAITMRLYEA